VEVVGQWGYGFDRHGDDRHLVFDIGHPISSTGINDGYPKYTSNEPVEQLMSDPMISIVTPSFNQGKYIRQTIDSVLNQDYPNFEYYVIDGGSTDDTVDILRSYGDRIHWVSAIDQGQADAINKGFQAANGDILAYINSDDYYLPGAFRQVARAFSNTNVHWVSGDYRIIDQDGRPIQPFVTSYKRFWRRFSSLGVFSIINYIAQPSTFWRRDLLMQAGCLDLNLHYALDYDILMRVFQIVPPVILEQPLSIFRIHKSSKGGSQFQKQFNEELTVLRRYNKNRTLDTLHMMHNELIKLIYQLIK